MFYYVEPEVAGGLGPQTELHRESGDLVVTRLHYEFDGWLGDALLTTHPCFILNEAGCEAVQTAGLEGVRFEAVEVTISPEFSELHPALALPPFRWMIVDGAAFRDDFRIAIDNRLVVSARALTVLRVIGTDNAIVEPAYR